MRVLEVTHYMPPHQGGIERVTAALVDGLATRGHEVRWIASATPAPPGEDGQASRVRAWNVLETRAGVPYPIWSLGALRQLRALIEWADVVHVHDCLYMGSAAAARASSEAKKPILLTQHVGYVPYGRLLDTVQRAAYGSLGLAVLRRVDARIACSAHVPEWFRAMGFDGSFDVIPNGVATERFCVPSPSARHAARERLSLPRDGIVVLFVGRLVSKKGLARVLEAQKVLASRGTTLLVIGDGPLGALLPTTPDVRHIRSLPASEMPLAYAAADVFMLPSRGEGLPLSVQEALLSGIPVVVSDDPAYVRNLADAPGVVFAPDAAALVQGTLGLVAGARRADVIAEWARARWNSRRFIDAYERTMERVRRERGR